MYKKYIMSLSLAGMMLFSSWICVRELRINRIAANPAFRMEYVDESLAEDKHSFIEMISSVSSGQRVVDYEVLEQTKKYQLSDKDYEALLRIVEAEAGGEDQDGKRFGGGCRDAERAGDSPVFTDSGRTIPER